MVHKAFKVIGEKAWIIEFPRGYIDGIFQESRDYGTIAEGGLRSALDFLQPLYHPDSETEARAKGISPRERINPNNPILSLYRGVDHLKLKYTGILNKNHIFVGKLDYVDEICFNDGNFEIYDIYREAVKRAGFKIR